MQVRDVMTEAAITETPAGKLRSAAERMWREQTGSLLITTEGRLTGITTERDVLRAVALGAVPDLHRATVDEAMTIDVYTVPPDMPLHAAEETSRAARTAGAGRPARARRRRRAARPGARR